MPRLTTLLLAASFLVTSPTRAVEGRTGDPATEAPATKNPATENPARVLTERIEIAGGQVVKGAPPGATYMPGDPRVERESQLTLRPGDEGTLSVTVANLQPSSDLVLYLRFGTGTDSHIRIHRTAGDSARETLELAFKIPADICDGLEKVKHRVMWYQVVEVAERRTSEEQERFLVLNCEDR